MDHEREGRESAVVKVAERLYIDGGVSKPRKDAPLWEAVGTHSRGLSSLKVILQRPSSFALDLDPFPP